MMLYIQYLSAMIVLAFQAMVKQGEELDEATEEDFYLRRLDAGLFSLQLIDCVVVECCSSGTTSVNAESMYFVQIAK